MRARTIAAACALAALAAGCGGGNDKPSPTAKKTPSGKVEAEDTPAPQAGPVVDGEGVHHGWRFRFTVDKLERSGPTVVVNAKLELLTEDEDGWQISDTFDDGIYQTLENGTDEEADIFDGVAMIDSRGRKKYLVARDSDGRCVCSNNLSDEWAYNEKPVTLQATLTAPPPQVKKVDLVVPHVKTFHDVPIAG